MRYSSGKARHGRARTKQRKRLTDFPRVWWLETRYGVRSVTERVRKGWLVAEQNGFGLVRFRNGKSCYIDVEELNVGEEDE